MSDDLIFKPLKFKSPVRTQQKKVDYHINSVEKTTLLTSKFTSYILKE